jgi:hypothetical protein
MFDFYYWTSRSNRMLARKITSRGSYDPVPKVHCLSHAASRGYRSVNRRLQGLWPGLTLRSSIKNPLLLRLGTHWPLIDYKSSFVASVPNHFPSNGFLIMKRKARFRDLGELVSRLVFNEKKWLGQPGHFASEVSSWSLLLMVFLDPLSCWPNSN